MKISKRFAVCLFTISFVFLASFPVYAASDNQVQYLTQGEATDYVGITIDGNYDDWTDKPHSKIQYPWDTGNNYHLGALFRDENFVYLHIKMSANSYSQFNGYNYLFTVDGKPQYVLAVPPDATNITEGNTSLVIRRQNGYKIIDGAEGVVTRQSGQPDEWEIEIPLDFFTNHPDNIKTITFQCSNIGPQEIIAAGTPTLPFAIAGSGLILATVGYGLSRRKRKA